MKLSLSVPTPLEYFATLVQSDVDFPLLEAAISLAQDDYPDLDVQQVLGEVDQLLARLKYRIPHDAGLLQKLRMLNQFFFRDLNFSGNLNYINDPDNSYVSVILRTRRAIAISLAVLWVELAQALGLVARGVGFPGHFMIKVNLPQGQVIIDPLNGESMSREKLIEWLEPFRPQPGVLEDLEVPLEFYLLAAPPRDIIARMLRNLKEIHNNHGDWVRLLAVLNRLIVLLPKAWAEYRDRGLVQARIGQTDLALKDLQTYLTHAEEGADREAIALRVAELQRAGH